MAEPESFSTRIRLSRSIPRLLAIPAAGVAAAAAIGLAGVLLTSGLLAAALLIAGAVIALVALGAAVVLLSIRLEVTESAVRVRWIGGERGYPFSAGPITRVRLRGEDASKLRASPLRVGWQFGRALLRNEEAIEVIRLAPTSTAILVPTERGRLAIGAASEGDLLDALARAAQVRQRLDELRAEEAAAAPPAELEPEVVPDLPPAEPEPPLMTGIERAAFEQRQADERAAAEALAAAKAAEAELLAAAAVAEVEAMPEPEVVPDLAPTEYEGPPRRARWTWRPSGRIAARAPSVALAALPLIGAGAAWGIGLSLGRMPAPESDLGRLTALALVLAGPATTIGAIMARAWWPRLVGVVVVGGLATSVFIGRALVGS